MATALFPDCGRVTRDPEIDRHDAHFVRIIGSRNRLVFGVYRRHMKTIGYLGEIDELFGIPANNTELEHNAFSAANFEGLRAGNQRNDGRPI
jgi:hypothetical protein